MVMWHWRQLPMQWFPSTHRALMNVLLAHPQPLRHGVHLSRLIQRVRKHHPWHHRPAQQNSARSAWLRMSKFRGSRFRRSTYVDPRDLIADFRGGRCIVAFDVVNQCCQLALQLKSI